MPYMTNGKRDYKKENRLFNSRPEEVKKRMARNKARAHFLKAGKVHKGDNKQVDHRVPLSKGGSTSDSNLRVLSVHANESYARTKKGAIK